MWARRGDAGSCRHGGEQGGPKAGLNGMPPLVGPLLPPPGPEQIQVVSVGPRAMRAAFLTDERRTACVHPPLSRNTNPQDILLPWR